MSRYTHRLKTQREWFLLQLEGKKNFEIRKNDRNFSVGDYLYLDEYIGEQCTYRYMIVEVTCICDYAQVAGYVVLGTSFIDQSTRIKNLVGVV